MAAIKQNTAARIPVRLRNVATGGPLAGVTFGQVTATVEKADGTMVSVTPASGADWIEPSTGAFANSGNYDLLIGSGVTSVVGFLRTTVTASGALQTETFMNEVVAKLESDTYAVAAAVQAKTDNLPTDPADESLLEAAITAATSPLATAAAVALVKAKTDNLPSDPADQSLIIAAIDALDFDVSVDLTPVMLSIAGVSTKIGTPANGTIAQDIADIDCGGGGSGVVSQGRRI